MSDEPIDPNEIIDNFPDEPVVDQLIIEKKKDDVNAYDIFRLANWVLGVAAGVYILIAATRIFYSGNSCNTDGVKEVWEYSKVFLNSIVSLVLGLYFGSKHEIKRKSS